MIFKMFSEEVNGYEIYYCEGKWFVEDEYGWCPYDTYEEAKAAAEEG